MIELPELLAKGVELAQLPEDHQKNLLAFLPKLQAFRQASGLIMVCSNGYRTKEHHEEIYREKNKLRQERGLKPLTIPWGSAHLSGHAADFLDPGRHLARFVDENEEFVRSLGFHFEAKAATAWPVPWLHIQDVSPKSGNLWFQP
jgi:hypothetical protein